jgi:hypothetical protein
MKWEVLGLLLDSIPETAKGLGLPGSAVLARQRLPVERLVQLHVHFSRPRPAWRQELAGVNIAEMAKGLRPRRSMTSDVWHFELGFQTPCDERSPIRSPKFSRSGRPDVIQWPSALRNIVRPR